MLRKLYKHEFNSLYRIMLPLYAVLVGFSAITRILNHIKLDKKSEIFEVWKNLTFGTTIAITVGVFVVGAVVIVVRFYQNMFSKQGYLTNTLPFKPHNHIVCKLICGMIVEFSNIVITFIAVVVAFGTKKGISEIITVLRESFKVFIDATSTLNAYATVIEAIIFVVIAVCSAMLMFYASMSIGQLFKNKILGSVISYFIVYSAVQFIRMIVIIIGIVSGIKLDNLFTDASFGTFSQLFIIFMIVELLVEGTAYFIITNHIISKKLNLE